MNRHLLLACVSILFIAMLMTAIMSYLMLGTGQMIHTPVLGLFSLCIAFTVSIVCLTYHRARSYLIWQRMKKSQLGERGPISRETVIKRHAVDWGLSKAEAEVALFVVKGFSNNEIANLRGSSLPTVKSQLGSIYQKSALGSRYQLMAFVMDEVCEAFSIHPLFDQEVPSAIGNEKLPQQKETRVTEQLALSVPAKA